MAVVTSDFLAGLMTNFRAIFKTTFDAADVEAFWKKLATQFPSNSDKETYAWLGTVPAMREWLAERAAFGLLGYDFSITNKDYEGTIAVDRNTLEDDKYGMITPRIRQLAEEAARYPDELIFKLINDGKTGSIGKAYDGTAYFANTRTIGDSGNIDNLIAGAYGATAAKIRSGIGAATTAMRKFKDDRARPMNLTPDTLVCPPDIEIAIRDALLPAVAGTVRPEAAIVKNIIVSAHLGVGDGSGDYYLFCTTKPLKPVFYQLRKAPEFVSLDKTDSENVFLRRQILYGVDMRCNVGWGDPRYGVMVDTSD